jgi:hypothetical protein
MKTEILQGTLDLMVLQALEAMGPMHGYGIARRIEQASRESLLVNQGTIYLCLIRLVQKGWITEEWGHFRKQPEGEVLFDFQNRAEAACGGDEALEAGVCNHQPVVAALREEGVMFRFGLLARHRRRTYPSQSP